MVSCCLCWLLIRSRICFSVVVWFCCSVSGSDGIEIDSLMHVDSVHFGLLGVGNFVVVGVFGTVNMVVLSFGVIGLLWGVMLLLFLGVILGNGCILAIVMFSVGGAWGVFNTLYS